MNLIINEVKLTTAPKVKDSIINAGDKYEVDITWKDNIKPKYNPKHFGQVSIVETQSTLINSSSFCFPSCMGSNQCVIIFATIASPSMYTISLTSFALFFNNVF